MTDMLVVRLLDRLGTMSPYTASWGEVEVRPGSADYPDEAEALRTSIAKNEESLENAELCMRIATIVSSGGSLEAALRLAECRFEEVLDVM